MNRCCFNYKNNNNCGSCNRVINTPYIRPYFQNQCINCPPEIQGPQRPQGIQDVSGKDGSSNGDLITITEANSFNLTEIGTYQVLYQLNVDEAGQLILTLNGNDLDYTVGGRATGTSHLKI